MRAMVCELLSGERKCVGWISISSQEIEIHFILGFAAIHAGDGPVATLVPAAAAATVN